MNIILSTLILCIAGALPMRALGCSWLEAIGYALACFCLLLILWLALVCAAVL